MRISDWSSDVCSSDLTALAAGFARRIAASVNGGIWRSGVQGAPKCAPSVARIATDGDGQGRTKKRPGARIPAGLPADSGPLRTVYWWRWRLPNGAPRSEEHKSELQSLMRIPFAVSCLKQS